MGFGLLWDFLCLLTMCEANVDVLYDSLSKEMVFFFVCLLFFFFCQLALVHVGCPFHAYSWCVGSIMNSMMA